MGETPRCDALNLQLHKDNADTGQCGMAFEELAKTFELELSEARAELSRIKEHHARFPVLDAKWLDPECHQGCQSLVFKNDLTAANQRIAEMEKESAPYWLCYALAEQLENKECERSGINCVQSSDCITEWCPQCAATHWLAEQRELSKPAASAQTKTP